MEHTEGKFAEIVDRHRDALINYLTHLTRSRHRAEDLAQEAFVQLYRSMLASREVEQVGPYLYRIATNLAVSAVRREQRWRLLTPRLAVATEKTVPAPDAGLVSDEIQRQVTAALQALPLKFRAPLVLYEIEEWSYEDIARALDCRLGTIKSRIARARELLRRQLGPWWNGENHERHRAARVAAGPSAGDGILSLHI